MIHGVCKIDADLCVQLKSSVKEEEISGGPLRRQGKIASEVNIDKNEMLIISHNKKLQLKYMRNINIRCSHTSE